ncbi:hypothetical protein [Parvularcula marina]|uniref:Uncharacterized protein n=1 Tax=Parvularcula marina TaxID=2292771 RepID=A0A371RFS3_9PROT|nr:hypothetical protein [Parvularcula marina]RFB04280.1 hypothetical protein DX908_02655 [Parvularcula marina]
MKKAFSVTVRQSLLAEMNRDDRAAREEALVLQNERLKKKELEAEAAESEAEANFVRELVIKEALDPARLAKLSTRIDTHQELLIIALLENQTALDQAQDKIDLMLEEAYVLEDGRRVFKTRDGSQIYDEHGREVEMDTDLIDNSSPHWDVFSESVEIKNNLQEEREALLEYQQKLDEAEVAIENGTLTSDDLDELDALMEDAPAPVQMHLTEREGQCTNAINAIDNSSSTDILTHESNILAPN